MKITYRKLFEILKEKEISKTQLKDILDLSSATLAKLSKNQPISMNTLVAICEYLKCQPSDVMEIVEDQDQETLLYKLREEKIDYSETMKNIVDIMFDGLAIK